VGLPSSRQVSLLTRNRRGNFSISRRFGFVTALGQDVQIAISLCEA
jgi:hypothetical protein